MAMTLWHVRPEKGEDYYLVAKDDPISDPIRQLAKHLGLKGKDPMPKVSMKRVFKAVYGRVQK